jgi:hypothetical protein
VDAASFASLTGWAGSAPGGQVPGALLDSTHGWHEGTADLWPWLGYFIRVIAGGINPHAGRNTARLALDAELPASVLADLTGISISTAERWSQWAERDWTSYIGRRAADVQAEAPAARIETFR